MLVQFRHMVQQHAKAGDILRVVLQDILQQGHLFGFQVGKVPLGYLAARQVVFPGFPQHHFLQPAQVAASQPQFPQPPAHMQQVQVRKVQAVPYNVQ